MYKVLLTKKSIAYLSNYFKKYREYYEKLYQDSWLWWEELIIDWYNKEAQKRKQEILKLLKDVLWEEKILWKTQFNNIVIKWRTKYLIIEWIEDNVSKKRIINSFEIR